MNKPLTPSSFLAHIRPEVRAMHAYHVADARGLVKLDAMENPYALPADLKIKLAARLAEVAFNRYPVPTYDALVAGLRMYADIPDEFGVVLGNGSDELIHLLSMAVSGDDGRTTVLAPAPSFVMYRLSALFNHVNYVEVNLLKQDNSFQLDVPAMIAAIESHRPALVYLPYPNNPTGCAFARADMLAVITAARDCEAFVVVDEAYQPFADDTWMGELIEFDHLLVMRTVSKLGLAGVRLGYMAGRADVIAEIDKVRPPYNINVLTEAVTVFMLEHAEVLDVQAQRICATRKVLLDALAKMRGVIAYQSHANFVLIELTLYAAADVFSALKARGILVKNLSEAHPLLTGCLRLTVGTEDENTVLIEALQAILA